MNDEVISISEIIDSLKKRWKIIVIITLTFTLLSTIVSFFIIKPKYESKTKLFIGKQENDTKDYNNNDVMMYQKLLSTYSEIIKNEDLVLESLDNSYIDRTSDKVLNGLVVTPRTDTQILEISYQDIDPIIAKDVVTSVTDEFIDYSKTLIKNSDVQIIQKAKIPNAPVSPNKPMNIAIAFILGLMVSSGLVFLLEFMDNTFKNKEDLEKTIGLPVIGVIPAMGNEDINRKHEGRKRR